MKVITNVLPQSAIYYQSTTNNLIQLVINCPIGSSSCSNWGETVISSDVTVPVNPETGISTILPTANTGYRVFYEVKKFDFLVNLNYSLLLLTPCELGYKWNRTASSLSQYRC